MMKCLKHEPLPFSGGSINIYLKCVIALNFPLTFQKLNVQRKRQIMNNMIDVSIEFLELF